MGYDWLGEGRGHEGTEGARHGVAPGKVPLTDGLAVQRRADPGAETVAAAPPPAARVPRISIDAESFSYGCPPLVGGDGPAEEKEGGTLIGGAASTMSTAELLAAAWTPHGQFKWWVKWGTDGTSGWIVQKITNTYSGTKGDGSAITNASVGAVGAYYEAWAVDASGGITGSLGATGNRDKWERPGQGNGSKGAWSMKGDVYWTATDPATSGFTSRGVSNAGSLLAGTSAPAGLSACLLARSANGAWDSSTSTPTHAGAAT